MQDSPFANASATPPQRPVIITIFAIFTIIGCSLAILSMFIPTDLFTRNLATAPPTPPQWIAYVGGGLAVIKLAGALQMLRMRRIGFFLYAAGESAAAVLSIVSARIVMDLMVGYELPGPTPISMETMLIITTGFNLLLSIVFIGVYASQLKKMV